MSDGELHFLLPLESLPPSHRQFPQFSFNSWVLNIGAVAALAVVLNCITLAGVLPTELSVKFHLLWTQLESRLYPSSGMCSLYIFD